MKIYETNILDVNVTNVDEAKVTLADKIIKKIHPLLDESYSDKVTSIQQIRMNIQTKKEQVKEAKNELEIMIEDFKKKKKIKKLLERLSKLVTSGIANDGSLRSETIILLKIIDKLPDDKIDEQLRSTMKNITKRFGKL